MSSDPLNDEIAEMVQKAREYWDLRNQAIETARAAIDMCNATGADPSEYEERLRQIESEQPPFPRSES